MSSLPLMSSPRHHRSLSVPAAIDRAAGWQLIEYDMADEQDHIQNQRGPPTYPYSFPPRRGSLPRRNTDIKHPEPAVKYGFGHPNKAHRRFSSVLNASESPLDLDDQTPPASTLGERVGDAQSGVDTAAEDTGRFGGTSENGSLSHLISPSIVSTSLATVAPSSRESSSSSGSGGSTVTERAHMDADAKRKSGAKRKRFPARKPNALNFLDSDSPVVTAESIRRSMEEASRRSPNSMLGQSPSSISASTASSGFRDDASDNIGDHETDRSTSPERGVEGNDEGRPPANVGLRMPAPRSGKRNYVFPDIPLGGSQHSHTPLSEHAPRVPSQGQPPRLPRPERVPVTGYELLSSRLSASSLEYAGPNLRPIYRRFEKLNHRLLLHLQDELCELEDQLHRIDAADTQNRRLPNCIFPASRRAEFMAGGELHWHKTDILGKIGFKLEQYNRILSSFRETEGMPIPTMEDIREYRNYLAAHTPIADVETHFLDATNDLVSVVNDSPEDVIEEEPIATPMPRPDFTMADIRSGPPSPMKPRPVSPYRHQEDNDTETIDNMFDEPPIVPLSVAVTMAVIIPILTFLVIPGYLGRLTVVFLVGLGALGALIQGGIVPIRTWELFICVGLYGAVMAVIAGIVA
ncbi:hypothetical protein F4677DRAFT_36241 [Hypoxylon crocopeplum]|nr:hypothetical protein F4677DRAFT_36241 [Hypoxylon crocopeplum]